MDSRDPIIVRRGVTWDELIRRVAARGDVAFPVLGRGARVKSLLARLAEEYPDVVVHRKDDGSYQAIVNASRSVGWFDPWPG